MTSASVVTLLLVALATLTSAYYVNQPSYGDQQVQSVQHDVSTDQHFQHAAYVNQPVQGGRQSYTLPGLGTEGGDGQHAIYINVNGPTHSATKPITNPCDDPVLKNHLINCYQEGTTTPGYYAAGK